MSDKEPLETSGLGVDVPEHLDPTTPELAENDPSRNLLSEAIELLISQAVRDRVTNRGHRYINGCLISWKPSFLPFHSEFEFIFHDLGRGKTHYVSGQILRVITPFDYALELLPEIRSNLLKEIEDTAVLLEQTNKIMGTNYTEPWWIPIIDHNRWMSSISEAHFIAQVYHRIETLDIGRAEMIADRMNRGEISGSFLQILTADKGDLATETGSTLQADPVQHTESTSEVQPKIEEELPSKELMQETNLTQTTEPTLGSQAKVEAIASPITLAQKTIPAQPSESTLEIQPKVEAKAPPKALTQDLAQTSESTLEIQPKVEAKASPKALTQDLTQTSESTLEIQPKVEAKASPKALTQDLTQTSESTLEIQPKVEAKAPPKALTQGLTQTAEYVSETQSDVEATAPLQTLTQEPSLTQTSESISETRSDVEAKAPLQTHTQQPSLTQTSESISETRSDVEAKAPLQTLTQEPNPIQSAEPTLVIQPKAEAKAPPKPLTQEPHFIQTAKSTLETEPRVEIKAEAKASSEAFTQEANPTQTVETTSGIQPKGKGKGKGKAKEKAPPKALTQETIPTSIAEPTLEVQPKAEAEAPPKAFAQESIPTSIAEPTLEIQPEVEAKAEASSEVFTQEANPTQTVETTSGVQPKGKGKRKGKGKGKGKAKAEAPLKAPTQQTNLTQTAEPTLDVQAKTDAPAKPALETLAQEVNPRQTANPSLETQPTLETKPTLRAPAQEATLSRQERKNIRKREKRREKSGGAQMSTTDRLLQFAAEEHREGVPSGGPFSLQGAGNQAPLARPPFSGAPAPRNGVMGLKWAYASSSAADLALRKEGFWLFEKPQTYYHYQPYVYVRGDLGVEQAPVVVDTNGERFLEPDMDFDGQVMSVNAQNYPWPDVRSKVSHPDMVPTPKLVEYQAAEAAGFTIWRHDRNLLNCRLLGCTKKTSDHDPRTVICLTCGPKSFIRYCSVEHQDADLGEHWLECGRRELLIRRVVDDTTAPFNFGRLAPAIRDLRSGTSFPRYRQITFAARSYGRYTLFDWQNGEPITLEWDWRYPRKQEMEARIERLLNVSLLDSNNAILVGLLYRTLRELLVLKGGWVLGTTFALAKQFVEEFGLDVWRVNKSRLCECEWVGRNLDESLHTLNCPRLCLRYPLEFQISGMKGFVEMMEARYWILRAWRQQHPTVPHWIDRAAGDGFDGEISGGDKPIMGEGWEGWGAFEEDITA